MKSKYWKSKVFRWVMNYWPCIWCSGGKVTYLSPDYKELHVKLSLGLRTNNRVGTVFGGSIYSSIDPHLMLMFMEVLGPGYVVWDKAASVRFVKPIKGTVTCKMKLDDSLIEHVKLMVEQHNEYSFDIPLQYEDEKGVVYATFVKTIYAANKEFYKNKLITKQNQSS